MNSVIEQYQHIIEQLVPIVQAPDFEELFKAITAEISKPHQFQIKLELNRLKKPCSRYIDLRGHVDGDVEPYEFDGKTHFMDAIAREVFENELTHYGSYTTGVFEKAVNTENNYRVLHQKEQKARLAEKERQEKIKKEKRERRKVQPDHVAIEDTPIDPAEHPYQARKVHFQSYAIRSEERMNYSISIEVKLATGETIKGTSSDLSVSGLKVKLPTREIYLPEQLLQIKFRGLEEEFALGLNDGVEYQVVATEAIDNYQYVRMKRTYNKVTASFDEFLNNFINGNKRRYKVNMENTEEAVIVKGYEQYYVPRTTSLPLFLEKKEGQINVNAILTTENNKAMTRYWRDEEQQLILPLLFTPKRLKMVILADRESILYSFTHSIGGKIFHYAALYEELQASEELKSLFFGFAAHKQSWRVHKLQLMDASFSHAHIPLSLPESASATIKLLNRPPTPRVEKVLRNCFAIVTLTDISELSTVKKYQGFAFEKRLVNKLKVFGINKSNKSPEVDVEVVAVDYVNLRRESRFLYQTHVTIEQPDGNALTGSTRDFSTKGIQIEMPEPFGVEKGEIILINLPSMQKLTSKFKLSRLPYEIMAVSKNQQIINVRAHEQTDSHPGRKFFQQLIQTNRSKLTEAQENKSIPGLSTAMRNMYVHACANMPFYIHRKGIRHMINVIGLGGRENSLHQLMAHFSDASYDFHLYPLIQGGLVDSLYGEMLKPMKPQDPPVIRELLVSVNRSAKTAESAVSILYSSDLHQEQNHTAFINAAVKDHLFFAYRIFISRTGRPDIDYIGNELKYVGNYAIHRAKVIEAELWGIHGVGDAVDITEEMLLRYGYKDTDIQIQKQAKKFYLSAKAKMR